MSPASPLCSQGSSETAWTFARTRSDSEVIAVLLNPRKPAFDTQLNDLQDAARAVGQQILVLRAGTEGEIDSAFARAKELHADSMLVGVSFFYTVRREQLVALAARASLPAIYGQREFIRPKAS